MAKLVTDRKEMSLNIQVEAPMIILPLNQLELISSECLVANPGALIVTVNTRETVEWDQEQWYDHFRIQLNNTFVHYFPSYLEYLHEFSTNEIQADPFAKKMWDNREN